MYTVETDDQANKDFIAALTSVAVALHYFSLAVVSLFFLEVKILVVRKLNS